GDTNYTQQTPYEMKIVEMSPVNMYDNEYTDTASNRGTDISAQQRLQDAYGNVPPLNQNNSDRMVIQLW
ncbi:MAG: hypothetical protein Q4A12_08510, partial [Eubacteriales bacterium]|nr:hypothetical protein [Eubacteriales bacterium]